MEQTWRWWGPKDLIRLAHIRQAGATGIVTALHDIPYGETWSAEAIAERKAMITADASLGLRWSVVESVPVHEDIKRRTGDWQGLYDRYCQTLRNLGRAGVDTFSFGAAYLGQATTPLIVPGDPNSPKFRVDHLTVPNELRNRLEDRGRMLAAFDRTCKSLGESDSLSAHDEFNRRALGLLTSTKTRQAFDLSQEDPRLRDRYGRHPWGQRAILARRLVEAGCSFVTMVMENPIPPGEPVPTGVIYNWDSHAVNGHIFDDAKVRLPHKACAAHCHRRVRAFPATGVSQRPTWQRPLAPRHVDARCRRRYADRASDRLYKCPGRAPP